MAPHNRLTVNAVQMIKEMLYNGKASQAKVSVLFGVSQGTISRIQSGHTHPAVPWPDGSTGAMPEVIDPISEGGWSQKARLYMGLSDELQGIIIKRVNEERERVGMATIPPADEGYLKYLSRGLDEEETEEFSTSELSNAIKKEDDRLSLIMSEFEDIVEGERQTSLDEDLRAAVELGVGAETPNLPPPPPKGPPSYNAFEWGKLKEIAAGNRYVETAEAAGDPVTKEAVCAAFWATRKTRDSWTAGYLAASIAQFEAAFRRHPELVATIEAKYTQSEGGEKADEVSETGRG